MSQYSIAVDMYTYMYKCPQQCYTISIIVAWQRISSCIQLFNQISTVRVYQANRSRSMTIYMLILSEYLKAVALFPTTFWMPMINMNLETDTETYTFIIKLSVYESNTGYNFLYLSSRFIAWPRAFFHSSGPIVLIVFKTIYLILVTFIATFLIPTCPLI